MPTYATLMRSRRHRSKRADAGLSAEHRRQGWYTMATGAWPGVHGSTNNTFFDTRLAVRPVHRRSPSTATASSPGTDPTNVLEAQSVAASAELAGKTGRPGGVDRRAEREHQRPDGRLRELLLAPRRAGVPGRRRPSRRRRPVSGCPTRSPRSPRPAAGRTYRPARLPAQQTMLHRLVDLADAEPGPHLRPLRLRHARRPATTGCWSSRRPPARTARRRWPPCGKARTAPVKVRGADGLIGTAAGGVGGVLPEADDDLAGPVEIRTVLHLAHPAERALRDGRLQRSAGRRRRVRTSSPSTSRTTCRRRSSAISRRRRPASSTRTPGMPAGRRSQPGLRPRGAPSTSWAPCSRTPTCCSPAPTRPTRSATRSSVCSPRPRRTARANPYYDRVAGTGPRDHRLAQRQALPDAARTPRPTRASA